MYFDLWCDVFLLYPFLYVIYYCSKFQLFKICQLVYSPLFFFLNSATFYVKKWTYRITVICLFLLAVNKLSSVQFREFDDRISHRLMLLYRRTKAFEKLHHSDNLEFKIVPPFTLVFLNVKLATTYI